MLERIIKKDRNEELEKILEQKKIDEQAKNLLQGILYKVEVSYKDYKKVKAKKKTEKKYTKEILENIQKRCNKISVINLSQKAESEEVQQQLNKNKFYVGEEIISYPIEEKILYAIEKKSRHRKILNNKYEEKTIAVSDLINTGKNMDRVEVLRDFNGWSWTTIKDEMENIEANLIYQTLQIVLGEEFLDNWSEDKDGIIDYLELLTEEMSEKYGEKIANKQKELLVKIAMSNTSRENKEFAKYIEDEIKKIDEEMANYENTQEKIVQITEHKKQLLKELRDVEKIVGQDTRLKEEYEKINEEESEQKIFNIKVLKRQINNKKQYLLEQIDKANYLLNPSNYIEEKDKLLEKKKELKLANQTEKQVEKMLIEFMQGILKCFSIIIKNTKDEDEIIRLIYQFRYLMLLPFNSKKSVKDIEQLEKNIMTIEEQLVQKAISNKVIADVPIEIMRHVFRTRIITLENLYYKITGKSEKKYVQIFDENISEEKFEITSVEKTKINKKIKIFKNGDGSFF